MAMAVQQRALGKRLERQLAGALSRRARDVLFQQKRVARQQAGVLAPE